MFAPNDAAFARIPQQVVKRLMRNKQKLVKVLKFHIVSGTRAEISKNFVNDKQ